MYLPEEGVYQVTLHHRNSYPETILLDRIEICFLDDNTETYGDRIVDALQRRHDCLALLRYNFVVKNIPFDSVVATSLEAEKAERIAKKSVN
eukprot:gene9612-12329_t